MFVTQLSELTFRHQSPRYYDVLRPVSYDELRAFGRSTEYVEERRRVERRYRRVLGIDERSNDSFLYATIVGFHLMKHVVGSSDFTYYFRLSPDQLDRCAFHVIDPNFATVPLPGKLGLQAAVSSWQSWSRWMSPAANELSREDDHIEPRIEVVVSCPVTYERVIVPSDARSDDAFEH